MLRIHRHDLGAVLVRRVHHQLSGTHQGLLVGKADALFLPDGSQCGPQAHHAHHGRDHEVRLGDRSGVLQSRKTAQYLRVRIRQAQGQVLCSLFIRHDGQTGAEAAHLSLHPLYTGAGCQGRYAQAHLLRYLQRLPSHRTSGS